LIVVSRTSAPRLSRSKSFGGGEINYSNIGRFPTEEWNMTIINLHEIRAKRIAAPGRAAETERKFERLAAARIAAEQAAKIDASRQPSKTTVPDKCSVAARFSDEERTRYEAGAMTFAEAFEIRRRALRQREAVPPLATERVPSEAAIDASVVFGDAAWHQHNRSSGEAGEQSTQSPSDAMRELHRGKINLPASGK
jgi:hypothetical protein